MFKYTSNKYYFKNHIKMNDNFSKKLDVLLKKPASLIIVLPFKKGKIFNVPNK